MRVENVKAPDKTTEEKLYQMINAWQNSLQRTCCALLGDADLAKDAVQETFIKAYKALPAFREECSEKTWLMRIAMNVCKDIRRGNWFRLINRHISLDDLPEPVSDPQDIDFCLMTAVLDLPIKQRQVILMYYYHNLTVQEIAEALGISQPAVSKRLKLARDKLRTVLREGEA